MAEPTLGPHPTESLPVRQSVRAVAGAPRHRGGAGGGIRTRTPLRAAEFKSAASAFPPLRREQHGLEYLRFARRFLPDGDEEAVLFEEWQDAASLYGWVGPNLTEPRLVPGVRELVEELQVAHYEVLATGAEDEPIGLSDTA